MSVVNVEIFAEAVAPDRTTYVTDTSAKCLFKFNLKGKLKVIRTDMQKPYSTKLIDNQLYVVDCDRWLVTIFDVDGNVLGTISTAECPAPHDLAKCGDGLYVAGQGRICVYTPAPDGMFIRHLNITPHTLQLSTFQGICFDSSSHIVAIDYENGVYLFTTSGDCVGHIGSDLIKCPTGVMVDEGSYVYVCSFLSFEVFVL